MLFWEYFSFVSLGLISISSGVCAFLVLFNNPKKKVNILSFLMNASVSAWSGCWAVQLLAFDEPSALFWGKILNLFSVLLTIFFSHWVLALLKVEKEIKNRIILAAGYALSGCFIAADLFSSGFISAVRSNPYFQYYSYQGKFHIFFIIFLYFGLTAFSLYQVLIKYRKTDNPVLKSQLRYILLGIPLGVLGGSTSYFLIYGISVPPFGLPLVMIYFGCLNYAMIRHRLMDIGMVIGKTGVYSLSALFVVSWSLAFSYIGTDILNLPLLVLGPLTALTSLAVFAYCKEELEKIAGKYFYYGFYSLKNTISRLIKKLNNTTSLDKILTSVDYALLEALKTDKAAIILKNSEDGTFSSWHSIGFRKEDIDSFIKEEKIFLINFFRKTKDVLIKGEIPFLIEKIKKSEKNDLAEFYKAEKAMSKTNIGLLVPLLIEDYPIGMIVLGGKTFKINYSSQEIDLLKDFCVQLSIALNNAMALDEVKKQKKDLEKFYQLTIGRELKMIELKNKIKDLEGNY